eukprot:8538697-Pyramimonas_sp.AAC.1
MSPQHVGSVRVSDVKQTPFLSTVDALAAHELGHVTQAATAPRQKATHPVSKPMQELECSHPLSRTTCVSHQVQHLGFVHAWGLPLSSPSARERVDESPQMP